MKDVVTKSVSFQVGKAIRTVAVVSALVALPLLAGCGESARAGNTGGPEAGDRQPAAERGADEQKSNDRATGRAREAKGHSEDAETRAGGGAGARAGNVAAGAREEAPGTNVAEQATRETHGGVDASEEVILKVKGNETRFAGTCSVGDEKRRIDGQAPERYVLSPGSETLRCEIRGKGPGTLNVELAARGEVRSVQRSGAGGSEVSLTYTEDRISIDQSSSGSGSQVQSTSVSNVSSGETPAP